ncbi:hypothetical protein CBL_10964 [Carabus blaptoides fortunei]
MDLERCYQTGTGVLSAQTPSPLLNPYLELARSPLQWGSLNKRRCRLAMPSSEGCSNTTPCSGVHACERRTGTSDSPTRRREKGELETSTKEKLEIGQESTCTLQETVPSIQLLDFVCVHSLTEIERVVTRKVVVQILINIKTPNIKKHMRTFGRGTGMLFVPDAPVHKNVKKHHHQHYCQVSMVVRMSAMILSLAQRKRRRPSSPLIKQWRKFNCKETQNVCVSARGGRKMNTIYSIHPTGQHTSGCQNCGRDIGRLSGG